MVTGPSIGQGAAAVACVDGIAGPEEVGAKRLVIADD